MWRAAARALRGDQSQVCTVYVLTDFKKAFGSIDRRALWQLATEEQYPLHILALSLDSCRWRRWIFMSDMTSKKAFIPSRGVGAVSADATFELACYMLRPLREAQKASEGKDGGERQTEVPRKMVRRGIARKTHPAENGQRQEASRSQHSNKERESWQWISLHVDDFSSCGAHHKAAILVSRE